MDAAKASTELGVKKPKDMRVKYSQDGVKGRMILVQIWVREPLSVPAYDLIYKAATELMLEARVALEVYVPIS